MRHFCLIYLFVIFFCFCVFCLSSGYGKALSGPYKSIPVRIGPCEKYTYQMHQNSPANLSVEIYNTSTKYFLIRGNFTVTRNIPNAKVTITSFIWLDDKWRKNYLVTNLGCRGMLIPILSAAISIKYDRNHCAFVKGKYSFSNVNMQDVAHLVTKTMEYGRTLWRTEMFVTAKTTRTLVCVENEAWIVPA